MTTHVTTRDIHGNEYKVLPSELTWRPSAYGIVINDGHILLTEQYKKFHLPGGGVKLGELPEDTVVREIREETGYVASEPRFADIAWDFYSYDSHPTGGKKHVQTILLFYVCELTGGKASVDGLEEDEKPIGGMPQWIPVGQLDAISAGSTVDWRRIVKQAIDR